MITFRVSTLEHIADMICGNEGKFSTNFPYRSSSLLTRFFRDCDLDYTHDGSTRNHWVTGVLKEISVGPATSPDLPSDTMVTVLSQLMNVDYFDQPNCDRALALGDLNTLLERYGLVVYEDNAHKCHIRNSGTGAVSALQPNRPRPLTAVELEQRQRIIAYFEKVSEDEFTEKVFVPFFQRQGFHQPDSVNFRWYVFGVN